jgi:hypothetical protein
MNFLYTLVDSRYSNHPTTLDFIPNINNIEYCGFMMWQGQLREVVEIHKTKNGIQIELQK